MECAKVLNAVQRCIDFCDRTTIEHLDGAIDDFITQRRSTVPEQSRYDVWKQYRLHMVTWKTRGPASTLNLLRYRAADARMLWTTALACGRYDSNTGAFRMQHYSNLSPRNAPLRTCPGFSSWIPTMQPCHTSGKPRNSTAITGS